MKDLEKELAVILHPLLYSNLKFKRAVSTRKLKTYIEVELKSALEEKPPSVLPIISSIFLKSAKLNWSKVATNLIRLMHEDDEKLLELRDKL